MEQNTPPDDNQSGARLGKLFLFWAVIMFVIMLGAQQFLDKRNNPNASPESRVNQDGQREVVLERNVMGHYVVDGKINGKTVTFMLDTGATSVSIPQSMANSLNLKEGFPYDVNTANGVIRVFSTKINQIGIGDIQLNQVHGSLNPYQDKEDVILLGMSFLRHVDMIQQGNQLILRY